MRFRQILCVLTAAGMTAALCGCGAKTQASAENNAFSEGDASIKDKVEKIYIDWAGGDIAFDTHDGNTVEIAETLSGGSGQDGHLRWKMEGTALYIRYGDPVFTLVSTGNDEGHLAVTLPEDLVLDELEIDSASGDISGGDIKAGVINAEAASGDIDIGCTSDKLEIDSTSGTVKAVCTAGDIRITTTSGDVYLEQKGNADTIFADATSGNIEAAVEKFNAMEINGTSSDVKLIMPEDLGFTAEIETTSGEFYSEIPVKTDKDRYIAGDGASSITINVTSGNVEFLAKK